MLLPLAKRRLINIAPQVMRACVIRRLCANPWRRENYEHRCIFIHVPRTGGTSIASAIFGKTFGHPYLDEFVAHDQSAADTCFKFAIVRHPLTRLVSAYNQVNKESANPVIKRLWRRLEIPSLDVLVDRLSDPTQRAWVFSIVHFRPQFELIASASSQCDFVGRFESFDESLEHVSEILGKKLSIQRMNGSHSQNASHAFTPQQVDVINAVYARDFEQFGYS